MSKDKAETEVSKSEEKPKQIPISEYRGGELTPEQIAAMEAHADTWIDISFRTGRTDQAEAKASMVDLYTTAKLAAPKVVVVSPNPIVTLIAGSLGSMAYFLREQEVEAAS